MKLRYLVYFFSLLFFYSCEKETDNKTSFEIALNECTEKNLDGEPLRLCLEKVEDSRCCAMCYCVWAGVAKASFTLSLKGESVDFDLATTNMLPAYRTDTVLNGYKFKLVNVSPYPGEGNDDPKATVQVSRQ